jgi:lipopolysaccharide biosynthesis glycosyltransferase
MIAIGLCADRAYLVPALVTLVSLADSQETAIRRNMSVRLLSPDITPCEAQTFEAIVRRLGFRSFRYRKVVLPTNLSIVHGTYISSATYLRFAFDENFVGEPYLLYLDADILIVGDMTIPFNTLRPNTIGAARDEINHTVGSGPALPGLVDEHPEHFSKPYFNAGALWLPTAGVLEATTSGAKRAMRRRKHIHFNDQDALNLWLLDSGSCEGVPPRFNRFELGRLTERSDWIKKVVRAPRSDPGTSALHFIGPDKPWLRRCPGVPGVRLYSRSLAATRTMISRARDATMDLQT